MRFEEPVVWSKRRTRIFEMEGKTVAEEVSKPRTIKMGNFVCEPSCSSPSTYFYESVAKANENLESWKKILSELDEDALRKLKDLESIITARAEELLRRIRASTGE